MDAAGRSSAARARRRGGAPRAVRDARARAAARPFVAVALAFVLAVALGVALAGCDRAAPSADARPVVAVSVLPQQWVVERLAGDRVRVVVMLPPGANEATYEPSISQMRALDRAVLYVKVGHPRFAFERAWLDALLADAEGVRVVDGAAGIELAPGDPHYWLVPRHVATMAASVARALADALPAERAAIDARLEGLRRDAEALDAELRARLAPVRGRAFLVFHPAFGYLAREYGLVQVAIEDEGKEPDAHELARLVARARDEGVRVIFVQPQFDRAAAQTIADEVGARLEVLDPLAPDWDDNLRRVARALAEGLAS